MPGTALHPSAFEWLSKTHVATADQELPPGHFEIATRFDSDLALIEAIGQSLRTTGYAALRTLGIESVGGQVVLTGRVPSYHQKQLAQAAVRHFNQVRGIRNCIEVSSGR